jgi:hypothetical protein
MCLFPSAIPTETLYILIFPLCLPHAQPVPVITRLYLYLMETTNYKVPQYGIVRILTSHPFLVQIFLAPCFWRYRPSFKSIQNHAQYSLIFKYIRILGSVLGLRGSNYHKSGYYPSSCLLWIMSRIEVSYIPSPQICISYCVGLPTYVKKVPTSIQTFVASLKIIHRYNNSHLPEDGSRAKRLYTTCAPDHGQWPTQS